MNIDWFYDYCNFKGQHLHISAIFNSRCLFFVFQSGKFSSMSHWLRCLQRVRLRGNFKHSVGPATSSLLQTRRLSGHCRWHFECSVEGYKAVESRLATVNPLNLLAYITYTVVGNCFDSQGLLNCRKKDCIFCFALFSLVSSFICFIFKRVG